jgi:hypothetical protein
LLRVVVIGSGATALAVLDALAAKPDLHVTLIRPARELPREGANAVASDEPERHCVEATISALRGELGLKFPPPKSHFGVMPETLHVEGWGEIWRSNLHGGLTQFWGGSMVPFTDRELTAWPIGRADLEADYQALASRIGITGADDALRGYLGDDFAARPPAKPIAAIAVLVERLRAFEGSSFDIIGGAARVAVETRPGHANACEYSGECMTGCRHGAVFGALDAIEQHRTQGDIAEECRGMAERLDLDRKFVEVRLEDDSRVRVGYDFAFVCAGCVHSVELLMGSLGTEPETPISDNMILSFPVFYGGTLPSEKKSAGYFALTNGMLALLPQEAESAAMFVQLYPTPDYFWQYNLPRWTWPAMSGLAQAGRNRLFWARAYVSSAQSQAYGMMRNPDGAELSLARQPALAPFSGEVWPSLRRSFAQAGFWVPPVAPVKARTSSHYAGGFPMGGASVSQHGALGNGAYLCDSANFPDCPAFSHTFTAMANARRIARNALRD